MTATLILSVIGLAALAFFAFESAPAPNTEPYREELDQRVLAAASGLPLSDSHALRLDDCWSTEHWNRAL